MPSDRRITCRCIEPHSKTYTRPQPVPLTGLLLQRRQVRVVRRHLHALKPPDHLRVVRGALM